MDPNKKKLQIVVGNIMSPITTNVPHIAICHAVTYQNAGTTRAIINGGWTLLPGGSVTFTNHTNDNLFDANYKFAFDKVVWIPGKTLENRIEIIEYHIANANQSHYDIRQQ